MTLGFSRQRHTRVGRSVWCVYSPVDQAPWWLPPARTQTLSVLGSIDGSTLQTLVDPAAYTFDPSTGNTVTIQVPTASAVEYLRLSFTANTGWRAAQVSEFEVYAR